MNNTLTSPVNLKLISSLPFPAWHKDMSLKYTSVNNLWCHSVGLQSPADAVGKTDAAFFPSWISTAIMQDDMACLAGRTRESTEIKIRNFKGKTCIYRCYRQLQSDDAGNLTGILCYLLDITTENYLHSLLKSLEARQNNWLRALQDHALITTMDRRGRFTYVSNSFSRLTGISAENLIDQPRLTYGWIPPGTDLRHFLALAEKGTPATFEFTGNRPDGKPFWMRSLIVALNSPSDNEQVFFELLTDLTEEKTTSAEIIEANDRLLRVHQEKIELITKLEVTARTDSLTGIPNRRAFFERADQEYARHIRQKAPLSILMIDIDHFKRVNDNYGHAVGDQALTAVAKLLGKNLRLHDVLGRLGGEEFGILLTDTASEGAQITAERLRFAINREPLLKVENEPLVASISLGLAILNPGETFLSALDRADAALYKAKKSGRNCLAIAE